MRVTTAQANKGPMATGRFDRQVAIVRPGAPVSDEWNEETAGEISTTVWASIATSPGIERFSSGEQAAMSPMQFFFRWRADLVKPTYRIEYDGQTFDVKSVEEIGRRQRLRVIAVARLSGG